MRPQDDVPNHGRTHIHVPHALAAHIRYVRFRTCRPGGKYGSYAPRAVFERV